MKSQSTRQPQKYQKKTTPPRAAAARPAGGLHPAIPWVGLALLAFFAYAPALDAGFIWDDQAVTANPLVTSLGGLWKIWLAPRQMIQEQHYWPMVYSTFWLEHLLGGLNPLLYHLDNILLHAAVALLLWRVLAALAVPGAWLGAALFAVHPVHAESVAWIIERKDVLSGALFLGAALAFLRIQKSEDRSQKSEDRSQNSELTTHNSQLTSHNSQLTSHNSHLTTHNSHLTTLYWLSLGLFAAALLSKSIVVGLPLALGLALWLREGRITKSDLRALAPFAALAAAMTLADIYYYHGQQVGGFENSGLALADRVQMAGGSLWVYLSKVILPWPLATFYPKWKVGAAWVAGWIPLAAWLGLLAGLWLARRRIGRGPLAAMAFFSLTLAPALGLVDFDFLLYSWVADRFQYLASAGPLALGAAALTVAARKYDWPAATARWGAAALIGVLGLLCMAQASVYHDSEKLFRTAVAREPQCWAAHNNLATVLTQAGRGDEALRVLYEGLRAMKQPDYQLTLELGGALARQGQFDEAERYYKQTLALKPDFVEGMIHYGAFLAGRGRADEAAAQYRAALDRRPENALAQCNLGNILRQQNKLEEAEACLRQAVELMPDFAGYRVNLAQTLADRKNFSEAIEQCERALELDPNNLDGRFSLGQILLNQGNCREAIAQLEQAQRLQPNTPETLYFLGRAWEGLKDRAKAIEYYQAALRLKPDFSAATRRLMALSAPPSMKRPGPPDGSGPGQRSGPGPTGANGPPGPTGAPR